MLVRIQPIVRVFHEGLGFLAFAWRRFSADNGLRIAASLSYTSLLALVPLIAIGVAVMAAFPVFDSARAGMAVLLLDYVAPHTGELVQSYVDTFVANTGQLTAIGVIGIAVTAIMLLANIEGAFNIIWRVHQARPMVTRLVAYWTVLTLGPLLLGTGLSLSTFFFAAANWAGIDLQVGIGRELFRQSLPFLLAAAAFTVLYVILPHRRIDWRHALAGGVVAAILFELLKRTFGLYVSNVRTFDAVYGTLSALPLFLLWMYLVWVVVLLGAVIAAAWPEWRANRAGQALARFTRESVFVTCLRIIERLWQAARDGRAVGDGDLSVEGEALERALEALEASRFVAHTEADQLVLTRDLDTVSVQDVYSLAGLGSEADSLPDVSSLPWGERLREMVRAANRNEHAALAMPVKALFAETAPARIKRPSTGSTRDAS